jgi:predicted DNA binding protein
MSGGGFSESRRFGVLKVAHYGDFLTDFSTDHPTSKLVLSQLSLVEDYSHVVLHLMPAREETLAEFLDTSRSYSDVKYVEVLRLRAVPPTVFLVKRSYGVQRALYAVGGIRVGPVIVEQSYKYFPILIRRGSEPSLLRYVRTYSPCELDVRLLRGFRYYENLDTLPTLSEYERRVLLVALREGYFDWPKRSTLEDIAGELGLSKVTVAEHLRKALKKLVEIYFKSLHLLV